MLPPLGLLLDVDGPISSPETRTISVPSIVDDLVTLAGAGAPLGFITGRSAAFMLEQVVAPLRAAGLSPQARLCCVGEKGGVWFPVTAEGPGEVEVDTALAPAASVVSAVRELVQNQFADSMFFDETKQAMVSVEQRTDVDSATYAREQARFNDAATALLRAQGYDVQLGGEILAEARGEATLRLDPSIIATDIESVTLDKAVGAARCLEYFGGLGPLPQRWRSLGDSPGDYRMADHLHAAGFDTAHVDVAPEAAGGHRPYDVIRIEGLDFDAAGAEFLARSVRTLGNSA